MCKFVKQHFLSLTMIGLIIWSFYDINQLELIPNLSGLTLIFLQVAYWNNDRGAA